MDGNSKGNSNRGALSAMSSTARGWALLNSVI